MCGTRYLSLECRQGVVGAVLPIAGAHGRCGACAAAWISGYAAKITVPSFSFGFDDGSVLKEESIYLSWARRCRMILGPSNQHTQSEGQSERERERKSLHTLSL